MPSVLITNKDFNQVILPRPKNVKLVFATSGVAQSWSSQEIEVSELNNYQNVGLRNKLMLRISSFIERHKLFLVNKNINYNTLEAIRYSLLFQSEKYVRLIDTYNSLRGNSTFRKIHFDLENHDSNLLVQLFRKEDQISITGKGRIWKYLQNIRSIFNLILTYLKVICNWFLKKRKPLDAEIDFLFAENSLRNVWYSDVIAGELNQQGYKTAFVGKKSVIDKTKHFGNAHEPYQILSFLDLLKLGKRYYALFTWYNANRKNEDKEICLFIIIAFYQMLDNILWQFVSEKISKISNAKFVSTSIVFTNVRLMTMSFKLHNLKTYLLQHGLTFTFDFEKHILQEFQLMWGSFNKDRLHNYGFNKSKIFVTGSLKYNKEWLDSKLSGASIDKNKIVFFPSRTAGAFVSLDDSKFMLGLVTSVILENNNYDLSIKPHPEDRSNIFEPFQKHIIPKNQESLDHVQSARIVISSTSTVGLEACCFNKDLIIISSDNTLDVVEIYKNYNAAIVVSNKKELVRALDDIYNNSTIQHLLKEGRQKLVRNLFNNLEVEAKDQIVESLVHS